MDWQSIRAEFPALQRWTYLNTATFGQLPTRATDAVARHWAHRDETACFDFLDWYNDADRFRKSLARMANAEPEDIAFAPNTAHALATVVNGLKLTETDRIVTLKDEFPNQLYLANLQEVAWENFYDAIDGDATNTKLVALSEVNYATGFRPPLLEISRYLKEQGIPFFVDGSQSFGALQFNVRKTPVDVYAVHAYKWMISPPGSGFFYISPEFRKKLPPSMVGWRSHKDWRNVDNLHHGTPVFSESAEKYEGGGLPNALLYAFEASVNMMLEIGPPVIERRVLELADVARQKLRGLGAEVADTGSQVVAARFPGVNVSDLAVKLRGDKILVAARHGHLRVSPHFYNNEDDLEKLEIALRKLL